MKKIFARISMELVVSDEEAEQLIKECGSYWQGTCEVNNEFDINKDFAKQFVEHGTLADNSYIPEDCITEA